ncbi:MAG: hypothetical protein ACJ76H_01640 [Bacteriovoracaceae bacterium]
MRIISGLLFCALSFAAEAKVCVLNFERPESPITKAVNKAFKDAPNISVKSMAIPLDIADCVRNGASEIVIVAHALESPQSVKDKSPVPLAYFREFTGEERAADIANTIHALDSQIADLKEKGDVKTARKVERYRETVVNYPANKRYVKLFPILPRAFAVAAREDLSGVKKIRLLSCVPEQVLAYYKDLQAMINSGIELDIAPKNKVMSLLEGKTVTSPDMNWLRKSINGEQPDL